MEIQNYCTLHTSPLSRPKSYSPMWASICIFLIASMSTKIEHDNAISTTRTLPTVKPHPNISNLLNWKKLSTHMLLWFHHSIHHSWMGQNVHETRLYAFSEPNPWKGPTNPGAVPPDIGNPMATEAECKHHCGQWNFFKTGIIPSSTLVILSAQHLKKVFQIKLNLYNKLEIVVFETTQSMKLCPCNCVHEIVDELFHTYDHATATNISKIDDTIKTPWDPTKPIEMFFKQVEDAQIFALRANLGYELPLLNIYVLGNITYADVFWDDLHNFCCQHNTHNVDWPKFKQFGPLIQQNKNTTNVLWEVQLVRTLQQMMTPFPPSTQLWAILLFNCPQQYYYDLILGD